MPLNLTPIDRGDRHRGVPVAAEPARGIILHWLATPSQEVPLGRKSKRRRTKVAAEWECKGLIFGAVRPDGENHPPETPEMERRMVLNAYALIACYYPIPSDAEVLYEVRR